MSISRTATGGYLTDDDGTGTTGTVLNNSERQSLLDVCDAWRTLYTVTSTGTQNDFSITSSGVEADVLRLNNASDLTLTGIAAPATPTKPGKVLILRSIGAGNVLLKHENAGSSAANRLINLATSADTPLAAGKGWAAYFYDSTSARWRMFAHDQGGFLTATFAAGNFTGSGTMTWTVASGDRGSGYWLRGNKVHYTFIVSTTTVGGSLSTTLRIGGAEWGGFLVAGVGVYRRLAVCLDNLTADPNVYAVHTSTTVLGLSKLSGNWSASTDQTYAYGDVEFQVS